MKRIAIFSDGTWNSPVQGDATNVLRLARAVSPTANGVNQIAFYDWGVGTDRKKVSGGISGAGIDKNIMDCYRFIVHNYEIGDELYLFGFSRGAYTARSLAGFIRNCGLLKREHAERIPEAYRLYRKRTRGSSPNAAQAKSFRERYAVADISYINFVGVWDTVGSLGIPVPFWGTLGEQEFLFHDTSPSKIILHARHALAIDENRVDFTPSLWESKPGFDLQQVWFSGAHADVGGGYKEQHLSDCACRWMVKQVTGFGLIFEPFLFNEIREDNPERKDALHNERTGIYKLRDAYIRLPQGQIHYSVKARWDADIQGYRSKSKALRQLLETVDGDWSRLTLVH
ncbi:MAG: hypothetical protein ACI9W6_003162 [Motiliproteus sp.]|jgi:uncharacterized protein (DUF2235 family)